LSAGLQILRLLNSFSRHIIATTADSDILTVRIIDNPRCS